MAIPAITNYVFAAAMEAKAKDLPPKPRSWKELQSHPLKQQLLEAAQREYNHHVKNGI